MVLSVLTRRIGVLVALFAVMSSGMAQAAPTAAAGSLSGKPCPRAGAELERQGTSYQCKRVLNKRTGKTSLRWVVAPSASKRAETWTYGPMVLDSQTAGLSPVDPEAVVLSDGRVRLYVDDLGRGQITSFTSVDGINFTADGAPPIAGTHPSIVRLPDGRYRMYFVRFDPGLFAAQGVRPIRSAVSSDGLAWTEEPGVRAFGDEPSVVTLADGRTLMALRRDSSVPITDTRSCNAATGNTSIWFATSPDGLNFTDVGKVIDGVTTPGLDGRAYGVELSRRADGSVVMQYEGCVPAYVVPVNESTLALGTPRLSPLRGAAVAAHYGIPDTGGAGGDVTFVVLNGKDRAYYSLRTMDGSGPGGSRQRVATATRG